MTTWREVRLGDLCEHVTVGHVGKMSDQYRDDGVLFFRSQDVHPFSLCTATALRVDPAFHVRLKKSSLRPGDVAVIRTGYPGTAAVVPEDIGEANCADLVIIRPGPDLDSRVVAGYLNSSFGRRVVSGQLVGAAQQHFNVRVAADLKLSLPCRAEQSRIGDVLDSFNLLIENNRQRIKVLEETVRLIYQDKFVRFAASPVSSGECIPSATGGIPDGWSAASLGDLCNSVTVSADPREVDGDLPAVGLEHLPRRSTTLFEWGKAVDLASRKLCFQQGDVLFGKIRPYFHKVAVAPVDGICSTDIIVLRDAGVGAGGYVLAVASSDDFVAHAVATSNGTKMPRADWKVLANYRVAIPPLDLLREWAGRIEALTNGASAFAMQNRALERARDTLLPQLMTGRVHVDSLGVDDVFGWTELVEASATD